MAVARVATDDHGTPKKDKAMVTEDAVLKALDKPRKVYSILQAVNPSGSQDELQELLLKMRSEKKVAFDIKKGNWRRL